MARAMHVPSFLLFASDATITGLLGGVLLTLALVALVAERLRDRRRRRHIDAVGWVPWTAVFLACAFIGSGLLTLAVKGWLAG